MKTVSENRAFGGVQGVYSHASQATGCDMTFGLFLPEQAEDGPVPLLWFLSGLTCTHENAMIKAGAQRWAAEAGIALCFPDTSPRGEGGANDADFAAPRPVQRLPAGRGGAGDHRAFDGRAWRADHRDELSGPVQVGLGLRADLQPHGKRLGPSAIFCLSRRR